MSSVKPENGNGADIYELPCAETEINTTEALLSLAHRIGRIESKIDKMDANITMLVETMQKHLLAKQLEGK